MVVVVVMGDGDGDDGREMMWGNLVFDGQSCFVPVVFRLTCLKCGGWPSNTKLQLEMDRTISNNNSFFDVLEETPSSCRGPSKETRIRASSSSPSPSPSPPTTKDLTYHLCRYLTLQPVLSLPSLPPIWTVLHDRCTVAPA